MGKRYCKLREGVTEESLNNERQGLSREKEPRQDGQRSEVGEKTGKDVGGGGKEEGRRVEERKKDDRNGMRLWWGDGGREAGDRVQIDE